MIHYVAGTSRNSLLPLLRWNHARRRRSKESAVSGIRARTVHHRNGSPCFGTEPTYCDDQVRSYVK